MPVVAAVVVAWTRPPDLIESSHRLVKADLAFWRNCLGSEHTCFLVLQVGFGIAESSSARLESP